VPGIPGAIGFEVGPAGSRGRNVVFVKGSTYYVDGYFLSDHAPGRASLVTAARRQYQAGR
jgi:hypothetical protein